MSTKTICDVCGKDVGDNYDYSVGIGAFHRRNEISVRVRFLKGGVGPSRWENVDLCQGCKDEALAIAVTKWAEEVDLVSSGSKKFIEHYPPNVRWEAHTEMTNVNRNDAKS